jgi:3-hydroxyacyl-[acyl-carrier-protein] dehydratase
MAMLLGSEQIKYILPHRLRWLLVDRLVTCDGESASAELDITLEHCAGHFSGHLVFPGVCIEEALAQTCGLLAFYLAEGQVGEQIPFLRGVDGVCFKGQVRPGDTLRLEVELTKSLNGLKKFSGKAFVGEKLVARVKEISIYLGE